MSTLPLPARFGKYVLEEFLGGGMSHVYRARDTVIGRTVAVKILTEAGCADPEAKARFLGEARMAGNIAHDNVLGIYDYGVDAQNRPFMVMEFLRGEDLRHAIEASHTGDLKRKLHIALQVARALEYVHTLKIIHRDIKPENVHLSQSGVAKLIDFGIAKAENVNLTRAGFVLGTLAYMAPEQVQGLAITEQADVYAFGLLLYELLTGDKPVKATTVESAFYCILREPLKPEPLAQAQVPRVISDLILACAAKDPAQRPRGFPPITRTLETAIADLEPAVRTRPGAPKAAWLVAAGFALLAVVVVAVGLYFAFFSGKRYPKTITTSTGEMVLVPAGDFEFGEKKDVVSLPAFYIDRTEVSRAAWAEFCKARSRTPPPGFADLGLNYPVVNVSILEARDFAVWAGKRLPNAREWEKAARGSDGRLYPWGNQPDPARAAVNARSLYPVDAFPNGASPCGALQMAGNAWELVEQLTPPGPKALDFFQKNMKPPPRPDEPWYMVRGGGVEQRQLSKDVIWDSATVPARWKANTLGFRCVKDAR